MAGLLDLLQTSQGVPPELLSGVEDAPGASLPPMAGQMAAPVAAPGLAGRAQEFDLRPQEPGWLRTIGAAVLGGPRAVDSLYDKADQARQGNVLGALNAKISGRTLQPVEGKDGFVKALVRENVEGRDPTKPLGLDQIVGWISAEVPGGAKLLGDENFMGKMKFFVDHYNHAAAQEQALMLKAHEDRQAFGKSAAQSMAGRVAPSQVPAALAADMAYAGEFPEGMPLMGYDQAVGRFGQGRQAPGGPGLLGLEGAPPTEPQPAAPSSRPAQTARDRLYPGQEGPGGQAGNPGPPRLPSPARYTMPGKAAQEAYTLETTAPAKARAKGLEEAAGQAAQTSGHIARRLADQRIPAGTYETQIDSQTGDRRKIWTGGAASVDLGRNPEDVGDLKAAVAKKALAAAAQGQSLEKALNPAEKALWESTVKNNSADEFLKLLGLGAVAESGPRPARQPNASAATSQDSQDQPQEGPPRVGEVRTLADGRRFRITQVFSDGTFDGEQVQ